jgi:hypothetical protein
VCTTTSILMACKGGGHGEFVHYGITLAGNVDHVGFDFVPAADQESRTVWESWRGTLSDPWRDRPVEDQSTAPSPMTAKIWRGEAILVRPSCVGFISCRDRDAKNTWKTTPQCLGGVRRSKTKRER